MKIERDPASGPAAGAAAAPSGAAAAMSGAAAAAARRTDVGANGAPEDAVQGANVSARPAATVALSARSRELHEALRLAKASDDVRHDVVKQIKTQVDNGTYSVDPSAVASGMLDRRA
jgi:flagellar biosynthesis anti-sigma factor FlgM